MSFVLDADIVNYLIKGVQSVRMRYQEAVSGGADFILCPIVHYQVSRFLKLKNATRLLGGYTSMVANWFPVLIDGQDWETAADIWAERHRIGKPIQDADLLIAVTALKAGATLVTNNTRHFEGPGLMLENWASAAPE